MLLSLMPSRSPSLVVSPQSLFRQPLSNSILVNQYAHLLRHRHKKGESMACSGTCTHRCPDLGGICTVEHHFRRPWWHMLLARRQGKLVSTTSVMPCFWACFHYLNHAQGIFGDGMGDMDWESTTVPVPLLFTVDKCMLGPVLKGTMETGFVPHHSLGLHPNNLYEMSVSSSIRLDLCLKSILK